MDKRRDMTKRYGHKTKESKPSLRPEEDAKKRKIHELMAKYDMNEAVALEIVHGILPLEMWLQKTKREKIMSEIHVKKVVAFSCQAHFSPKTAISILRELYTLPAYQKQKLVKLDQEKQAYDFAQQEDVPLGVAQKIITGDLTIEEYQAQEQKKQERREKAIELHHKCPEIALSVCYQLVDENLSVQEYLERKTNRKQKRLSWYQEHIKNHQEENKLLSLYLQKLHNKKIKAFFSFLGHNDMFGLISGYTPYTVKIKDKNGKIETFEKRTMQYLCRASYVETVLSLITVNRELQHNDMIAGTPCQELYQIADELLQENKLVQLSLSGGEVFRGTVKWASPYDIKLLISSQPKASVVIFRHAVVAAEELK